MKKIVLLFAFLSVVVFAKNVLAQVPVTVSTVIEIIDGKACYIHEVMQGQTLYSISKAYNVGVDEIKSLNRLSSDQLQKGYLLKIPAKQTGANPEVVNTGTGQMTTKDHEVQKGESLYKIAIKYSTTVDNIKKLNPGLTDNIAPGQLIKVPISFSEPVADDNVKHVVATGETLYGIAKKYLVTLAELKAMNPGISDQISPGQEIIVGIRKAGTANVKSDTCDCSKPVLLSEYNVALLIPLYLDKAYFRTMNTQDRDKNEWYSNPAFSFIQFYEGMQLALDTLRSAGLKLKLHVFDLDETDEKFSKVMNNSDLKNMNLIIGPFQQKYLDTISRFSYANRIPMVSCYLSSQIELQEINPYYFNPITSIRQQMRGLSDYFKSDKADANMIIAYQANEVEKKAAMDLDSFLRASNYGPYTMVNLTETGLRGATSAMVTGKENVLVLLANGELYIENIVRSLNDLKKTYKITMFGLPGWLNYENIDLEFLEFQNTHFFSSSFIDFEREDVRQFAKHFQQRYKCDAEKQAYMGYDISLYFLSALQQYGPAFPYCIQRHKTNTLTYQFQFEHSPADGYRNRYISIYRMKDFQLWRVQ